MTVREKLAAAREIAQSKERPNTQRAAMEMVSRQAEQKTTANMTVREKLAAAREITKRKPTVIQSKAAETAQRRNEAARRQTEDKKRQAEQPQAKSGAGASGVSAPRKMTVAPFSTGGGQAAVRALSGVRPELAGMVLPQPAKGASYAERLRNAQAAAGETERELSKIVQQYRGEKNVRGEYVFPYEGGTKAFADTMKKYQIQKDQLALAREEFDAQTGANWGQRVARWSSELSDVDTRLAEAKERLEKSEQWGLWNDVGSVNYDSEEEAAQSKQAAERELEEARREYKELTTRKAALEEDIRAVTMAGKYGAVQQNPDFADKSRYQRKEIKDREVDALATALAPGGKIVYDGDDQDAALLYNWINGDREAGQRLRAKDAEKYDEGLAAYYGQQIGGKQEAAHMTPNEVAVYNYLYATEGASAAKEYYEFLKPDLNQRNREAEQQQWAQYAKEHPVLASGLSVLQSPQKGISYLMQAVDKSADGKIDQNAPYNKFSYIPSAIRGQISSDLQESGEWGGLKNFLYGTGMSMGDFLVNAGLGMGSKNTALALMGTGAAADAVIEAKDRGLDDNQAFALGTVAGLAEIVTEKVSLETLLDKTALDKSAVGYFVKNVVAEGSEEVASDAINLFADVLISQEKSQWSQAVAAYEGQGYSEKDAFWRAVRDQAASMGVSFAGGALSGGVMAGARVGIDAVDNTRQGAKLRGKDGMTQETYQAFVDEGLDSDPDSEAFRLAMQMQGKVDKKGKLSDYDLGRLYRANVAAIEAEGGMDTTEAEMGVEGEKNAPVEGADTSLVNTVRKSIPEMKDTKPVTEVTGGELPKGEKVIDRLVSFVNRLGNKVNRPGFGDVLFSKGRLKSSMIGHGMGAAKVETFAAVPAVIQKGVQIDHQENWKGRGYDTYTFSAPVTYKGQRTYLGVIVSKDVQDGRYYLHEVVDENGNLIFSNKSNAADTSDGRASLSGAFDTVVTTAFDDSIPQTPGGVNRGEVARRQKVVWEAAETGLGENGTKALRYVYNETLAAQVEPEEAYRDFRRVYTATLQGETLEGGSIPETIRMAAEDSARKDLKAAMAEAGEESQTFGKPAEEEADLVEPGLAYDDAATAEYLKRMDPREVERLDRVARALGTRVRVVDSVAGGAANAQIRGSKILMDKHTKMDVVSYVLGHEFTHRIQDLAEGEYMAFREALDQETLRYAAEDIQAIYQKEGREIDLEAALDEAAANMAGKMLEDGALLDEFIERNRENKTLLERMRDVIRAIWSKLTGEERRRAKTAEGKLTAALEAAAKNAKQGETGGESRARFSIKESDIKAVQSIGRKSVNDLTSEEIKVVEPFARRYYQEMGAKSPFFRAWFGDWRVNDQTPVQIATQRGDARGVTLNEDTGWNIQVSGKVFNETAAHVKTPNVMAQPYIPFINDIVKKAILLDSHTLGKAKSQNSVMMHDLYAVADIGNGPEVLKLYVEEMNDPNQADTAKRAYQLQNIERQQSGAKGSDRSPSPVIRTADIKSVADLFQAVKARDKAFAPRAASKVVDGDGKPLVVYHATWAEPFTVFDRGRLGENTEGNASDPWLAETAKVGFWFSTQNLTGRAGNRAEAVYLDLKSPYQLKSLDALASELQERGGAEGMIDWLEEQGYDGLEVQDDEFGGTSYVVLNPTQIKSATDNIGTFDKENPDIRFSLKGTERVEDAAELRRENEELREKYEYWKKQTQRSQAGKVSEEVMLRRTRGLLRDYGIKENVLDSKAVAHKLQAVYDDIGSGVDSTTGGEMTFRAAKERVREIAAEIVANACHVEDGQYREYKDLRDYARTTRLQVSEEVKGDIADYEDFRKRNMGRLRLVKGEGTPIDTVFQEMAERWPEFFNDKETMNPADQLLRIAEVLDRVYKVTKYNPLAGNLEWSTDYLANKLMAEFWTMPGEKPTFADREARKRAILEDRNRERVRDTIARERARSHEKVEGLKKWYAERDGALRERKADSEARNRLLKLAARMKRMPTDNTNKALIRELVGDLDTEARHLTGKKLTELTELRRWYEGKTTQGSDTYDPDFILDKRTADNLKRLEMKHIDDMSLQDVQDLTQVLLNLENEIRTSKRLIGQEEARDVYQLGEQTVKDLRTVKGSKATGVSAALDKHIVTETLSPVRQVRRMVGYKADSPLVKLTEGLADGQRKMMDYQMRAGKPFERFAQDKNFTKEFSGQDAKTVKLTGWVQGKLQEVEITPAMRVSLWLHSQNDQNALHMRDGGVRVPNLELYRKGKLADAYAAGTVVKLSPDMAKNLWGRMTPTERAFAREAQRYFKEVSQPAINEVSRKLKGYDIAEVENYYPIRTDKTFGKAELETLKFDGTIEGMGFLKERQNFAHNPMYLEDVNTVVEQAIRMHGKYVGLAIPVRNFGKVWNVSTAVQTENGEWVSYGDSVQNAVQAVWGKTGYDYITKLMTDLQGGGKQAPAWAKTLGKVRSNYAGAVLTLNASVAMKQAASYPTAAAVLGWGPLVKAMKDFGKVDLDLIAKYTPLQWYRSQGFSTKELGDIQNYGGVMKEVLGKKGLNWIQGIDLATTRKLWKASEYYVRDNSPSLKVGSEAYYRAVADIYNRVIEETQPNYTTMQRPQLLRSDDTLMGNLAMFKTQPFQNFNILYDAAGEYRAVMRRAKAGEATQAEIKNAKTNLSRAVTSQVGQLAVFAAMTMAWAMFRGRKDKYEDDKGNVTLWSALGGLGKDMLSGTASMVPFGTEVYEFGSSKVFGERYYGMEPVTVEAIGNAATALSKLGDTIWGATQSVLKGEDVDWKGMLYQLDDSADDISKVAGIPYENVTNLFNAVARWTLIGAKGKYLGEYAALHLTKNAENQGPYMDLLYDAMEHDRAAYDKLWSQMVKDGFDREKIKSAMETRMKKAQGVTKVSEMGERYVAPDDRVVYEEAVRMLEESRLWGDATEEQKKKARDVVYDVTAGQGKDAVAKREALEEAGVDEGTYALYKLALEMVDKPTESGKLGSYINDEREEAMGLMEHLSGKVKAELWELAGGSEKSNPWK